MDHEKVVMLNKGLDLSSSDVNKYLHKYLFYVCVFVGMCVCLFPCARILYVCVCVCSSVHVHGSPAVGQWHLEQGLGQLQLLLLDGVAEHLSVRVVSVGLVRQLKQLPDGHPQRPAGHLYVSFRFSQGISSKGRFGASVVEVNYH